MQKYENSRWKLPRDEIMITYITLQESVSTKPVLLYSSRTTGNAKQNITLESY